MAEDPKGILLIIRVGCWIRMQFWEMTSPVETFYVADDPGLQVEEDELVLLRRTSEGLWVEV